MYIHIYIYIYVDIKTLDHETIDITVFVVLDVDMSLYNIMSVTHTVIPCPKCTAATHELTYRRNVNYKARDHRRPCICCS